MKHHFEYVPLPLSIAVNCLIGIMMLPAACVSEFLIGSHHGNDRICGLAMIVTAAVLMMWANRLVYAFMKSHMKADLTVSQRHAEMGALLSAVAAMLPAAAGFMFGMVSEKLIGAVCINTAVFVFALTIYYSQHHEPAQRNR